MAGHLLRASIDDTPKSGTREQPSPEDTPFPWEMPPAPLTTVYLEDQRPLLYGLTQALLGHKKPHCIQTKTEKVDDFL